MKKDLQIESTNWKSYKWRNCISGNFNFTRSKRGTAKNLITKVPLAGKTGTTNIIDAWFIGFPNLVIGVYRYDNPKTLGKYETGSKAASIFKNFVKKLTRRF